MSVVVCICLLGIFYCFFGYPVLVYMYSKNRDSNRRQWQYPDKEISVLMVVCNESEVIQRKITNILNLNYEQSRIQLVIVDDASDDSTVALIKDIKDDRITLIQSDNRQGKASGINRGMEEISTELVLLLDARQVVGRNVLYDLSSWFYPGNRVAAVSGELKFKKVDGSISSGMDAYQKYEKLIRSCEAKINSVPGVSGAIYMLRRDLFEPIPVDTILDDVLIPMNAAKNGDWIGFDERAIAWDIPSDDMEREKRRKTRTLNGNYQILFRNLSWCLPGLHPVWFAYASHKVMRLAAPFLAIIAITLSIILAIQGSIIFIVLSLILSIGVLMYPLSLYFEILNKNKLIRIGTSFVALNWFNLLGFVQYIFSDKKQSWK